jgi:hypothetical protein
MARKYHPGKKSKKKKNIQKYNIILFNIIFQSQ